jgi:hypothetical protein
MELSIESTSADEGGVLGVAGPSQDRFALTEPWAQPVSAVPTIMLGVTHWKVAMSRAPA